MVQWIAIALGIYCSASWVQSIRLRDAPAYAMIANPGFVSLTLLGGLMSYISYGLAPFIFLYVKNRFNVGAEVGLNLGIITALAGGFGATTGGILGDYFKRRHPAGRMLVLLIAVCGSAVCLFTSLYVDTLQSFYIVIAAQIFIHIMWLGPCAASIQDLVLPRMRGTATAVFFLGTTVLGLGIGPYMVGLISDVTGRLQTAMLSTLLAVPLVILCVIIASRAVPKLEASVVARAQAAGEAVAA
jgi:MFS family permease